MKPLKIVEYTSLALMLGIGGLQMYHVNGGILTNYGADFVAPLFLYYAFRARHFVLARWIKKNDRLTSVIMTLVPCFVWEFLQMYDFGGTPLAITRGRFDPFDLLAYTLGVAAALIIESLLSPRHTRSVKAQ